MKKLPDDLPPDSPQVIEARIAELERKMDRLRSMYESYFMGSDRMAPNTPRREMNRLILEMQQIYIRNSALRFRFQSLMNRWNLHITYWNRTMREMEMGTYRRDVAKAQRHMAQRGATMTEEQAIALGIPVSRAKVFVAEQNRRVARQKPAGLGKPDASPTAELDAFDGPATDADRIPVLAPEPADKAAPRPFIPGMTEADVETLHRRYEAARRQSGDPRAMNLDQLKAMLRKQVPRIMQEHMAFAVDFDVSVKEGRVVLKAKPVK